MIRLLWRSDVHLADRGPASRKDDWMETTFGKLEQVKRAAAKLKVDAVIDGGDLFHVKSPSRNTHALVHRATEHHADYPCPVYCTPGNHDAVYGDYAFLPQQPLGILFASGVLKRLYDEHEAEFTEYIGGGHMGEPTDLLKVRVVGIPYHGTKYDMLRFQGIKKGDEDFLVVVAHVLASNRGGTMFEQEDVIKYADLAGLDPDVWCFRPGTQITDWNGCPVPIEEVAGSQALLGRTNTTVVEQVHPPRQVDEEIVVLDVEGVPSELIPGVTAEHPFWVAHGLHCRLPSRLSRRCHPEKIRASHPCSSCHESPVVNPEWTAAVNIKEGDYVSIPFPKIPDDAVSEPGLARLLGYYMAEGHIIENRNKEPAAGVGWSFHVEERELHADVRNLVQEHFGLETKERSQEKYGTKCVQVCAYGTEVAAFCVENGGRFSAQKRLSPWVWGLSASSRLELLTGWMLGDGHARSVKTEVMGGTSSPALANQMFLLALSVGLSPYYTIRPEGETTFSGTCGSHTSPVLPHHIITFYGDDAELLSHRMGVRPPSRSKTKVAGFFHDGLFWRRVRSVGREHYKGPVYNMRTSTNEYVAGLLLTHNCFGHWHKDQGIQEIDGKFFVNIGSLTRGALIQDEMDRKPGIVLMQFERGKKPSFQTFRLKVRPAEEVFDVESRVRAEDRENTMDAFVASVRETLVDSKEMDLADSVEAMADISDRVREKALLYLEQAR